MAGEAGQSPQWLRDVTPASWIAPRLQPFLQDVGSVIPSGFEAYARLFHPVEEVVDGVPRKRRWSDIAAENGRVAHPEMQFHMVSRPAGDPVLAGYHRGDDPSWGSLPLEERRVLVELLRGETTTRNVAGCACGTATGTLSNLMSASGWNSRAAVICSTPARWNSRSPQSRPLATVSGPVVARGPSLVRGH